MSDDKVPNSRQGTSSASANLETATAERKFLHDLANPLAIAFGMIHSLKESTAQAGTLTEEQTRRLLKTIGALEKMSELLTRRRAELVSTQSNAGKATKKAG